MSKLWHQFWTWYHEGLSQFYKKDSTYPTAQFVYHRLKSKQHDQRISA